MKTSRLEAFSDGVMAIIITIMVLELKVPHGTDWAAISKLLPVFGSYIMSFVYVGIYWNNHHHLLHVISHVSGKALWANLHLLFWLSLIPFVSGWMGENKLAALPVALYGVVLLCSAIAWSLLQWVLINASDGNTELKEAVGKDWKGKLSIVFYAGGIGMAFLFPGLAIAFYVLVAIMWFVPDRRYENAMQNLASKD